MSPPADQVALSGEYPLVKVFILLDSYFTLNLFPFCSSRFSDSVSESFQSFKDSWQFLFNTYPPTIMRPLRISICATLSALTTTVSSYTPASTAQTDALAVLGLANLGLYESQNGAGENGSSCNLGNVATRKEWGDQTYPCL